MPQHPACAHASVLQVESMQQLYKHNISQSYKIKYSTMVKQIHHLWVDNNLVIPKRKESDNEVVLLILMRCQSNVVSVEGGTQ